VRLAGTVPVGASIRDFVKNIAGDHGARFVSELVLGAPLPEKK
jgi:hypothetical protein